MIKGVCGGIIILYENDKYLRVIRRKITKIKGNISTFGGSWLPSKDECVLDVT